MVREVWRERHGPAHGGLLGHIKELRSHLNSTRELQEHGTARFTFYQVPLHCLCVEGEREHDETADDREEPPPQHLATIY